MLIEQIRTLYRKDNLTALLPLGEIEAAGLFEDTTPVEVRLRQGGVGQG